MRVQITFQKVITITSRLDAEVETFAEAENIIADGKLEKYKVTPIDKREATKTISLLSEEGIERNSLGGYPLPSRVIIDEEIEEPIVKTCATCKYLPRKDFYVYPCGICGCLSLDKWEPKTPGKDALGIG